jgi:DnaK suppressor protein
MSARRAWHIRCIGPHAMATNEFRRRLEQELRATKARLHDQGWPLDSAGVTEATTEEGMAGDSFDRIERTESRERNLDARVRLTDRVDRIVEALARLDDGSYGTCAVCGEEIAPRRLHAIPEATTCVRCQENLEVARDSPPPMRFFKAAAGPAADEDA